MAGEKMMDWLAEKIKPVTKSRIFEILIDGLLFCNPVALLPQVWTAIMAPSVEGISVSMMSIFVAIQAAMMLKGISLKSMPIFLSMLISVTESLTVIVIVLMRS